MLVVTQQNISLAEFTSLKAGGLAKTLIQLEDGDVLQDVLMGITEKLWVLGSGTNTLISDKGLDGTVLINTVGNIRERDKVTLTVDSGADWDKFVRYAIDKGLYGLEFMSGIPGTVGGAVVGNIAAYGQKVADTFIEATVFNTASQQLQTLYKDDLSFDYRSSNLQQDKNRSMIVLDATFKLSQAPTMQLEYESALKVAAKLGIIPHSLADRRKIIMETRRKAGSLLSINSNEYATAGSFFRNPIVNESQVEKILSYEEAGISKEKLLRQNTLHSGESMRVSAAHVLLAAGFRRGQTWGKVRLHPDHILKIENTGGAKAQDIYDVVELIVGTVASRLNIQLIPEVQFLGNFSS